MKVIDLLNKIAKGEEVPKKIKYENRILYLEDEAEDYEPTFNYYDKDGENALFEGWIGQYLNDEVEILEETLEEEKKIPEKLIPTSLKGIDNLDEKIEIAHIDTISVIGTVNEIIDYLESKGE